MDSKVEILLKLKINKNKKESRVIEKEEKELTIEERRLKFYTEYRKNHITQIIVSIIFVVLCLIGSYILLSYPSYLIFTFLGIILLFVGLNAYSKSCATRKQNDIKDYVNCYRQYETDYIYKDEFEEVKNDPLGQIDENEIKSLNLLKEISIIDSNNITAAKIDGLDFKSASVAIYKNKKDLSLLGKFYHLKLNNSIDGKIIFNIYKNDVLELNTIGLIKYSESDIKNCDLYSSFEKEALNNIISENLKSIIGRFEINEYVTNVCILIENNNLYTFIKHNENCVDIPSSNPIDEKVFDILKSGVDNIVSIFKNI